MVKVFCLNFKGQGIKPHEWCYDAPPSSLKDSIVSPKVKPTKKVKSWAHSLVHIISSVEGMLKLQDGITKIDKQLIYSHGPAQTKQ
jgi:hypothetical protein